MGECGCIEGNFQWKIIDQEGWAWLLGIYPSCDYCESSVGLQFFRVKPDDWHLWDVENIPTLEPTQNGNGFIEFIGPVAVKKAMEKAIIGYKPPHQMLDELDAEVLSGEAFPSLRDAVFETRRGDA